jgi:hypothetical protein
MMLTLVNPDHPNLKFKPRLKSGVKVVSIQYLEWCWLLFLCMFYNNGHETRVHVRRAQGAKAGWKQGVCTTRNVPRHEWERVYQCGKQLGNNHRNCWS